LYARYNCDEGRIEKDIVVYQFAELELPRPLVIEVNGVYHYCRNSERPLGKDILKQKALYKLGFDCLTVPYFEWTILEHSTRKDYLEHLI
jgi:hypothetical protein